MRCLNSVGLCLLIAAFHSQALFAADETVRTPSPSLYERLGGEPAIRLVVDDFVARALTDPKVNFVRKNTPRTWEATPENVGRLKKHMVQFLCVATGSREHTYEGKDMRIAHKDMQITSAQFDALTADLTASFNQSGIAAKDQGILMAIVHSTKNFIVEET